MDCKYTVCEYNTSNYLNHMWQGITAVFTDRKTCGMDESWEHLSLQTPSHTLYMIHRSEQFGQ